ncbi:MAG TPA: hypothetical protein VKB96_10660 [Gammaproteobacteria bacterium]|nr:hypothetical protein [Gammaproteobacteria bacterium]
MSMYPLHRALILMLLMLGLQCSTFDAALLAAAKGQRLPTLAPMAEKVTPAVVNIATRDRVPVENPLLEGPFSRRFFNMLQQYQRMQVLGSDVIMDVDKGYIVANYHVTNMPTISRLRCMMGAKSRRRSPVLIPKSMWRS